ncbi:LysM domain-containing protein [Hirschfeldia incana]|nr:LysM domain-containing protein [Hirschfeldia incana]
MLTDRGRRVSICIGTLEYGHRKFRGGGNGCYGGGFVDRSSERCRDWSPPKSSSNSRILRISSPTTSPPPSATSPVSQNCFNSNGAGYIEHRVSKFDTLAGIAIKYGVEVADITKLNGLVTDLQMFALNSLRIPLPGRHPPSRCVSNSSFTHGEDCSEEALSSATNGNLQDVFDPFHSLKLKPSETKISPAMDSLQGYYGLKKPRNKRASHPQDSNDHYLTPLPPTSTPLNQHRKSRSLVDAVIAEVNQTTSYGYNKEVMKPMRRRQKSEADFSWRTPTPELVLKESRNNSSGGFSAIAGKGLALRPKASSRTNLSAAI